MASIIGNAGSGTLTTTEGTVLFDGTVDGGPCNAFLIANTGGVDALVMVNGLHSTEAFPVPAGDARVFVNGGQIANAIGKITGHVASGTTTLSGGVVRKA